MEGIKSLECLRAWLVGEDSAPWKPLYWLVGEDRAPWKPLY